MSPTEGKRSLRVSRVSWRSEGGKNPLVEFLSFVYTWNRQEILTGSLTMQKVRVGRLKPRALSEESWGAQRRRGISNQTLSRVSSGP